MMAHQSVAHRSTQHSGTHARYVVPSTYDATLHFTHPLSLTGHTPPARTHVPPPTHQRKARAVAPGNQGSGHPGGSATHRPHDRTGPRGAAPAALFRPFPTWPRGALGRAAPGPLASRSHFGAQVHRSARQPGKPAARRGRGQRRGRPSAEQPPGPASADRKCRGCASGGAVTAARRKWPSAGVRARLQ